MHDYSSPEGSVRQREHTKRDPGRNGAKAFGPRFVEVDHRVGHNHHEDAEPARLALHNFWWFPVGSFNPETGTHHEPKSVADSFPADRQQ